MLDIVTMEPVVDVHRLINAMGEIEDVTEHEVFGVFQDMTYTGCNESYLEIDKDCLIERLCDWLDLDEHLHDTDEELLKIIVPEDIDQKVWYRLFQMIVNGELPEAFVVLIWW